MRSESKHRLILVLLLWALPLGAADAAAATPDAAPADSLASAPADSARASLPMAEMLGLSADEAAVAQLQQEQGPAPFISSWTITPKAAYSAKMQKTGYTSDLTNSLTLRDKSSLSQRTSISLDDYRTQNKTVETRSGNLNYNTDGQRDLTGSLALSDNWTRDEITNSANTTNVNRRETRLANASLKRKDLELGGISHDMVVNGSYNQQIAEQIGQRNDISEAALDGALRSEYRPREWLSVHSGTYAMTKSGERSLGLESNPSSSSGDSLRVGVFYQRDAIFGGVTVAKSNFQNRYLDYNRNANGIPDTINVAQKIVQELERDDAVTLSWENTLQIGGLKVIGKVARDVSENSFRASRVGTRERRQDAADLRLGFRPSRLDTLHFSYSYLYKWDDQTYKGASSSRGRQVTRRRDVALNLAHALFRHTDLNFNFRTGISQDIAEGGFNVNDRDRLDSGATVKMDTRFDSGVTVNLSFDARRTEDISIRRERSGNNSIKDTYEIAPSYLWPLASWLDLNQSFRVWIQYTDYVFSDLEDVNKLDDYNKRGNLTTKVTIRPNSRLTLSIRHDLNLKNTAKKSRTDAAGSSYYSPESDQTVSNIDFSLQYRVSTWLSLDGTTYRKRDFKETFGTSVRETERFSGEVAVGGHLKKDFGTGKSLTLGARRYFADGDNVQEVNRAYWDADLELTWRF